MGPKLKKKAMSQTDMSKRIEETSFEETEEEKIVDPYAELRYTPQPARPQPQCKDQRMVKVSVLRKRRQTPFNVNTQARELAGNKRTTSLREYSQVYSKQLLKGTNEPNPNLLSTSAISSKPLLKWSSPGELPLIPPPIEVLRRVPKICSTYTHMLDVSFKKENDFLQLFEEEKHQELNIENYLMKKTGKSRQSLLLRKQQHLPHIDHIGKEKPYMTVERTLTPTIICGRDIFSDSIHRVKEKNGIRRTLTRKEKGYTIVTDWVGYPEVTDIIAEKLNFRFDSLCQTHLMPEDSLFLHESDVFIPKIEELGVVGLPYDKFHKKLKEIMAERMPKKLQKQRMSIDAPKYKDSNEAETFREVCGYENLINDEESKAGLIVGQIKLFWTQDPERSKKKWIIDLGCVAEIGKDSIGSITMINIGTTAVHFKWEKIQPSNVFQLSKYNLRRFVFDHWGSVILPGDTFRIPVLYKCIEPGFYSEDWRFITQPVMENGAEIITRLWGITRQYDPYRRVRQQIDEELEKRMARAIAAHRVTKIVDYLTLKEVPLKDTRFPLVHLGPDLFHLNNPWLKYHCASVFRLGKLATIFENKRGTIMSLQDKSILSFMLTDAIESASELILRPKALSHSETVDGLRGRETTFDIVEDIESKVKTTMISDNESIYTDEEEVTSIYQVKKLIEELISPDFPVPTTETQDSAEDEDEYIEPLAKNKRPLAINLTNPDFSVDQIRENILTNVIDSQEQKEAHFLIMSEQVSRLLFSTDMPMDNWKIVVGRTLLCNAMDSFCEFADSLKMKCCEGQLLQQHSGEAEAISEMLEYIPEEEQAGTEEISPEMSISSTETSELTPSCLDSHPRRAIQYLRYQDQYYSRLICLMYSILGDYVDNLDNLLSEAKRLKPAQEDIGFTRVRNIPMNISLDEMLSAPLPPSWVKLAQRMDNTIQKNFARKEALFDGQ